MSFITTKFTTIPTTSLDQIGIISYGNIPGLTSLILNHISCSAGFDFQSLSELESVSFPQLINAGTMGLLGVTSLTSISMPKLTNLSGYLQLSNLPITRISSSMFPLLTTSNQLLITSNPTLTSVEFPVVTANIVVLVDNPNLSAVTMSNWIPTDNVSVDCRGGGPGLGSALDAASVNHILARCVLNEELTMGNLYLDGDACYAPTGQGITDFNTLVARGVTVLTGSL